MATKQTDYIRANHIDSISPLNRYNDQQKNELNYIIQILINKDADRFQRWKSWSRLPFWVDPERDLAMTLVLAGTSMEDTDIVNWVHNNIIRGRTFSTKLLNIYNRINNNFYLLISIFIN